MKPLINVIGHSGSGKTYLIRYAIKKLKDDLNYDSAVFKYIHEHKIDKEGSDSYLYGKAGANYSITKNSYDETVIFLKKEVSIKELSKWIQMGPFKVDIIFTEGFRSLNTPTILCLENFDSMKDQLNKNVEMISGLICNNSNIEKLARNIEIPIVDIRQDFQLFLKMFNII
ncbi:MAG: hypothetical protein EU547_03595 [Promethearchaeota archaeon]|nr:MAG: hypothetical protein EU547_03595 [Candidatus Lokiarchaeota archaeon]